MSRLQQNSRYKNQQNEVQSAPVVYTKQSHETWHYLYKKQLVNLQDKATPLFFDCLEALNFPKTQIPSLADASKHLIAKTGWEVVEVNGLINGRDFFELLANKKFPSTTYIRSQEEITISKDPDIFHELFGHVPMLMDFKHSYYIQRFGELGLSFDETERALLQRLYWFTYETGLINTSTGDRIFGGSLLSSLKESTHVFYNKVNKQQFSIIEALRTPYRADKIQSIYFVLESIDDLFAILDDKKLLQQSLNKSYHMGEYPASFLVEGTKYESVGCCEYTVKNGWAYT